MMLGARTAAWGGKTLPYDAEVEWLKPNSIFTEAYIDTGVDSADDVGFDVTLAKMENVSSDNVATGVRYGAGDTRYFIGATVAGKWYFGWNTRIDFHQCVAGEICNFWFNFLNDRSFRYSGQKFADVPSKYSYGMRIMLHAYRSNVNVGYTVGTNHVFRFYRFKISVGSEIVRDFKPVRVGDAGCWCDALTNTIYPNIGTGFFDKGPDKT